MDFSKMRNRITFQKPVQKSVNSMSENIVEYEDWKTVWAYVAPKTGREYDEAQKLRAETTYNVITRYFDGITADMRIMFNGRILKIESVLNIDERKEQLQIVASEVDNYGKKEC